MRRHAWLVVIIALSGCSSRGGEGGKRALGSEIGDIPENQDRLFKLQGYISCVNEHSARVFQIADRYLARVEGAPAGITSDVVVFPAKDPKVCLEAIEAAKRITPPLPELEAAGDAFAEALTAVFAVTTEGHRYSARGSEDYAPSKLAALHPKVVEAFRKFDDAQGLLFDHVYRLNHEVHADQLARREARDGRKLPIITGSLMLHAEDLVRHAALPWERIDRLDVTAIAARLRDFEDTLEELTEYARINPQELDPSKNVWKLTTQAEAFAAALKQLVNRVRESLAYTESERVLLTSDGEHSVPGTPAAVIESYNRLVELW
jgi:hypothetical protein